MSRNTDDSSLLFDAVLTVLIVLVAGGLAIQPAVAGAAASGPDPASPAASGVPASESLAVQEDGPEVTLEETTVTQQRGDVVALNLTISGDTSVAHLRLGSDDVGFAVQFTVWDRNGDGQVSVLWNTARSAESDAGLSIAPDPGGQPDMFLRGPTVLNGVSRPVESAAYPVTVVTPATGNETDLGTVFVEERASEDLTVHTAPASDGPFESAGAVEDAASGTDAGETIAVDEDVQDWIVLRLAASGLSGYVDEAGDLDDADDGVTLTVTEREASLGMNEEPIELQLGGKATLHEAGDDVYFLVVSASALLDAGAEVGDEFEANFTVTEANEVTQSRETLSTTFTLVEGRASFDLEDDQIAVGTDVAAQVSGTSTWAPGTDLLVHLSAKGQPGNPSFTAQSETAVGPDGTWSASLDLSEGAPGQPVTVRLFHLESNTILAKAEGELR